MKTSYILPFLSILAAGAAVACDPGADASDDGDLCPTWYEDKDRDGHGDPDAPMTSCTPATGWVESSDDCDDTTAYVNAAQEEVCDGIDNDCAATTPDRAACENHCSPVVNQDTKKSYLFCSDEMAWTAASDTCKRQGSYLVQVDDDNENDFIALEAEHAFGRVQEYWLGASDTRSEGVWTWEDGVRFWEGLGTQFVPPGRGYQDVYDNWPPDGSQPDDYQGNDCLTQWGAGANRAGRWNDTNCETGLRFVCERD